MKTMLGTMMSLAVFTAVANTPPEITNVRARQRTDTKLVDIYYDAADADGDSLCVKLAISDDGGSTYYIPTESASGDLGANVLPGQQRHIVWDAGVDWDGEYSDRMRVKIEVTDRKGCPGIVFGDEVYSGGFLMGQDELSEEGVGLSKHVSIPWNYCLGKYEVTVGQYCEFLNWAYALGWVNRDGSSIVSGDSDIWQDVCPAGMRLCEGGISWKVNEFIVAASYTNKPVNVSWYGAMAFCRFYGYDLPTEAEWEKAARGVDHEAMGTHWLYPWGSGIKGMANYGETVKEVGSYESAFEAPYHLCDMIGNASEWTRSVWLDSLESHSGRESLTNMENKVGSTFSIVCRGVGDRYIYQRFANKKDALSFYYGTYGTSRTWCGFRVCRRPDSVETGYGVSGGSSIGAGSTRVSTGVLTFENWATRASNQFGYVSSNGYSWGLGFAWECMQTSEFAHSGQKCLYSYNGGSGTGSGAFSEFVLPTAPGNYKIVEVRMYAGNYGGSDRNLQVETSIDGKSYSAVTKKVPPGGYTRLVYTPNLIGRYGRILFSGGIYLDDVEVIYDVSK